MCLLKDQSHWLYRCCRQVDGIQWLKYKKNCVRTPIQERLANPIRDVGTLMCQKLEFLWCNSPRRVLLLDKSAFVLRDGLVDILWVVRNLGAFFNVTMSMNDHINRRVWSSYYQLCRMKSIHPPRPHYFTSWIAVDVGRAWWIDFIRCNW